MSKFFIGAKNLNGRVEIAEIIEADHFAGAYSELVERANRVIGTGRYHLTAVNEVPADGSRTAEFLEGKMPR